VPFGGGILVTHWSDDTAHETVGDAAVPTTGPRRLLATLLGASRSHFAHPFCGYSAADGDGIGHERDGLSRGG
jgi:hypothetical protein